MLRRWMCAAICAAVLVVHAGARAAETVTYPFQGIRHIHRTDTIPRNLSIHIVEIDLKAPGIGFRLTPPSAQYPNRTLHQTTRNFLIEQNAQLAINGGFFAYTPPPGAPYTRMVHLAVSNGVGYAPFEGAEPAINMGRNNVTTVVTRDTSVPPGYATTPAVDLWNAVGGNEYIVFNGQNTANWNELHPRTAAGVTADNKLLLFTVDGRNPGHSGGMTTPEMANMLISYGATHAINLDGGGSTTLVMADPTARVVNVPVGVSNVPGTERSNGNNLAVFARPTPPPVPANALARTYRQETGVYSHVAAGIRSNPSGGGANYGNEAHMRTGFWNSTTSGGKLRSVLAFDLADIPRNSIIHSVALTLYANSITGTAGKHIDLELHKLAREVVESEVTWNRARAGENWTTPGGDFGGLSLSTLYGENTTGYKTFVSTVAFVEAAQQALDQGVPLSVMLSAPWAEQLTANWYMRFSSDDNANTNQRPVLNIQYTVIPEPTAAAMLLATVLLLAHRRWRPRR